MVVDEYLKSPLFDDGGQFVNDNEQVGGNGVAIENAREGLANHDVVVVVGFGKDWRYPTREWRPLGEWWKNHILPQCGEKRANMAIIGGLSSWSEAVWHVMGKLIGDVRTSLYVIEKLRNSIVLQVFDYLQSRSVEGKALDFS